MGIMYPLVYEVFTIHPLKFSLVLYEELQSYDLVGKCFAKSKDNAFCARYQALQSHRSKNVQTFILHWKRSTAWVLDPTTYFLPVLSSFSSSSFLCVTSHIFRFDNLRMYFAHLFS